MKPWELNIECFTLQGDKYLPDRSEWLKLRREYWLNKFKASKGCSSCDITNPVVLTFDKKDVICYNCLSVKYL